MDMSSFTGLLSIFGFVVFLGLALVAEAVAKQLHRRGVTIHKIKYELYNLKEQLANRFKR